VASFLIPEEKFLSVSFMRFLLILLLFSPHAEVSGADTLAFQVSDSLRAVVRDEYQAGRFWHGVGLLKDAISQDSETSEGDLLLLAEGELGWGNWRGVLDLLEEPLADGSLTSPRFWSLLGRAREEMTDWEGAEEAYAHVLASGQEGPPSLEEAELLEIRLRSGRVLGRIGDFSGAQQRLTRLFGEDAVGAEWLALELARLAAEGGAKEATLAFLSSIPRPEVRRLGWELPADALLADGDSTGAEAAYWGAIPSLTSGADRRSAWERIGVLRVAQGDSLGAKGAFHQVLLEGGRGSPAMTAASNLLTLGFDSLSVARRSAEALAGAGRDREALQAWEAYEALREGGLPPAVSLALARIHLRLGEATAALGELEGVLGAPEPGIGAPALVLKAQALRALGRGGEARQIQDTLVSTFPSRPEAVEVLFLRADALQERGDFPGAIRAFEITAALAPTQNLAGQARMRLGQLHLSQDRNKEAVAVFEAYLSDFPEGRRWDEAAYWAGHTLLSMGREEEGADLLERLRGRFDLSYYSVMAGVALGVGYQPGIPVRSDPLSLPDELRSGLVRVDLLTRVGLGEGVAWEVGDLMARGRKMEEGDLRRAFLLRLALELNDRGLTREGINLGWEVRRLGEGWNRHLLAAIYPFPYREMVMRGAQEMGLDPFLMAGLMRQESAFWHQALSRADARGLMQVLPATGAQLARARGPSGFNADVHLYRPEVNLHLGMGFFSDLRRRFGEDLSILLSAYNAGPTRALRWREFPEAGDLPRFVERIPFTETRGYVKNVLLNREIYAWLYGSGDFAASTLGF
jgi:soluble lytic murein transglycosylase